MNPANEIDALRGLDRAVDPVPEADARIRALVAESILELPQGSRTSGGDGVAGDTPLTEISIATHEKSSVSPRRRWYPGLLASAAAAAVLIIALAITLDTRTADDSTRVATAPDNATDSTDSTVAPTSSPTAMPAPAVAAPTALDMQFTPLEPGAYISEVLGVPVTFDVPDGWFVQWNRGGLLVLSTPESLGPGDHGAVFVRPTSFDAATTAGEGLEAWLAEPPPRLEISPVSPLAVGDNDGSFVDVRFGDDPQCERSDGACALLLSSNDHMEWLAVGVTYRLLWFDDDTPFVVVIATPSDDELWLTTATELVEAMEIAAPGPQGASVGDLICSTGYADLGAQWQIILDSADEGFAVTPSPEQSEELVARQRTFLAAVRASATNGDLELASFESLDAAEASVAQSEAVLALEQTIDLVTTFGNTHEHVSRLITDAPPLNGRCDPMLIAWPE